ncbi:hypothetical protein [Streptomyces albipurpureus]|uniref:Uncharacterized protein n=1 Tax=Streptomyces albipurpureus TaxID=2897419 RepID=A0ABT0ULC4_9ACTN|nr:hypothetical protein [Streptomyces sp. CWNU-1]MCM2388824.1 hypothetical protein [Streptomyces sp. CWNU-1]
MSDFTFLTSTLLQVVESGDPWASSELVIRDEAHRYHDPPLVFDGKPFGFQAKWSLVRAKAALTRLLGLERRIHDLRNNKAKWKTVEFTLRLFRTSESETGLPTITAPPIPVHLAPLLAGESQEDLERATEALSLVWRCVALDALTVLNAVLAGRRYEFAAQAQPNESSPCGVIRFAAPRIPRAPGLPAYSPVSSTLGALAA